MSHVKYWFLDSSETENPYSIDLVRLKSDKFKPSTYIWCRVAGPWDPPPPRRGRVTTPRPPLWYCGTSRVSWQSSRQQNMFQINNKYTTPAPPLWYCGTSRVSWQASRQQNMFQINNKLWYCGTSRVSWQASRQQNMFQINNKYTTPAPPCGTVVLLECRGKQVDSRTCSK